MVVAPNTSLGASLQLYLARQLAMILDEDYDIDIIERHHRNKADKPSGTAMQLANSIIDDKQEVCGLIFKLECHNANAFTAMDEAVDTRTTNGLRPKNFISINAIRSGNLPGEHEVCFTSSDEMISIKHTAFDRKLFTKGVIKIVKWLDTRRPGPGIYTMMDVLGTNLNFSL